MLNKVKIVLSAPPALQDNFRLRQHVYTAELLKQTDKHTLHLPQIVSLACMLVHAAWDSWRMERTDLSNSDSGAALNVNRPNICSLAHALA